MHFEFDKDVRDGDKAELEWVELLDVKLHGSPKFERVPIGIRREYDWAVKWEGGKCVTFEFKNDIKSEETGNVAVETMCRGEDSGITVTTADYFGFKLREKGSKEVMFYLVPASRIRMMIVLGLYERRTKGGDPGSETEMFLFSTEEMRVQGFRVDIARDGMLRVRNWLGRLAPLKVIPDLRA